MQNILNFNKNKNKFKFFRNPIYTTLIYYEDVIKHISILQIFLFLKHIKCMYTCISMVFIYIHTHTHYFFWIRGNFTSLQSAFCGLRWWNKTLAISGSYKRCTPWLEFETCCADLELFVITLRPLGTIYTHYCLTINYSH